MQTVTLSSWARPADTLALSGQGVSHHFDVAVILPVYNEARRFAQVQIFADRMLHALASLEQRAGLFFVNDGSTDETRHLVEEWISHQRARSHACGLCQVVLPINTRKAGVYLAAAACIHAEVYLFVDADNSFHVEDVLGVLEAIQRYDIVVAAKQSSLDGQSAVRRVLSQVNRMLVSRLLPFGVYDTQTGLKAFRRHSMQTLCSHIQPSFGFAADFVLLYQSTRYDFRVLQFPVRAIHQTGSHVRVLADSLHYLRVLFLVVLIRSRYVAPT